MATKNESNKGDYKGDNELIKSKERIKTLESEIESLKQKLRREELINQDHLAYLENEEAYLFHVEMVMSLIPSFAKWGYKPEDKKDNLALGERLTLSEKLDPEKHAVEKLKNLYQLLEEAIPRYRAQFDQSLKIKSEEEKKKTKNTLTPNQEKLKKFCLKKGIDLMGSIGEIHYEAEAHGFTNLKGKKILHRSTVGKMLAKIRPQ